MYAVRITPYNESIGLDEVDLFLKDRAYKYVVGKELEPHIHFHIITDTKLISTEIYESLKVPADKKGNTVYSQTLVKDQDKATMYAVKDGDFRISSENDMWTQYVEKMSELSFEKPQSYLVRTSELSEQFIKDEITDRQLWVEIIKTRAYFNLRVNLNNIDEYVRGQMLKKHPRLAEIWANERKLFSSL